jgi:hypothetical protein
MISPAGEVTADGGGLLSDIPASWRFRTVRQSVGKGDGLSLSTPSIGHKTVKNRVKW